MTDNEKADFAAMVLAGASVVAAVGGFMAGGLAGLGGALIVVSAMWAYIAIRAGVK